MADKTHSRASAWNRRLSTRKGSPICRAMIEHHALLAEPTPHEVKKRSSLARLTEVLKYQFEVFNTRPSRNQYANRAITLRTPNAASTSSFPDISQNQ